LNHWRIIAMTLFRPLLCAAVVASLAACQARTPEPAAAGTGATANGNPSALAKTISDAARKIDNENITLRSDDGTARKAEITPAGDLIIDGKPVALDASQRRLLLDYRARVSDIAQAGAAIGAAGAELAGKAVTEAIGSIFSGNPDDVGKRVEAQADGIKQAARKLCDRVPALREAHRKVVAAIPEFAPFAEMNEDDSDKCHQEIDAHDAPAPSAPAA
jgi:hypothetical protein